MNDIKKMSTEGKSYFLGNIVVCQDTSENISNSYLIIDGQQRITSLTIIISIIRYIAKEQTNEGFRELENLCRELVEIKLGKNINYKLRVSDLDKVKFGASFRYYIQQMNFAELNNLDLNSDSINSEYIFRLQEIYNALFQSLNDMYKNNLLNLVNFIRSKCKFIFMEMDNFSDGHSKFCSLNTPGEPISALEYFRAKYYGQLVKDKGLQEADRLINKKISILNEINEKLGPK